MENKTIELVKSRVEHLKNRSIENLSVFISNKITLEIFIERKQCRLNTAYRIEFGFVKKENTECLLDYQFVFYSNDRFKKPIVSDNTEADIDISDNKKVTIYTDNNYLASKLIIRSEVLGKDLIIQDFSYTRENNLSFSLSDDLMKKINEYCDINNIAIDNFITDVIREKLKNN